ncbi:MAG: acetyl-CoA carboxylase biotin carboxyl carrier protein subunit [Dehalococcoidia bacterium]|nr:MAG: acetyl-CoA carboxylase biotin carboxyl carrier protein subunit [Dehalococcoidia bacterium]
MAVERNSKNPENVETPITIPMPGLIITLLVKVGDTVKIGDNIAIMEAMKMEIDLPSPVEGVVKSLNFKKGDNVIRHDVLAIIGK